MSSGLGIPHSEPPLRVPITDPFVRPVVHSAPIIGLVHYYGEDEEEEEEENNAVRIA